MNASTLKEPEEIKLAMQVVVLRDKLEPYFAEGRYQDALVELAELREPVDAFFDKVMVMVDDKELRINRLTMLEKLRELFLRCLRLFVSGIHRKADREKPHLTINQSEATLCLNTIRLASYSLEINTGGWDAAEI